MNSSSADPDYDCAICPRLREFILTHRSRNPDWHNAPVDTWVATSGDSAVQLLIAGLAPGLKGANRTGRPFTGDFAGDLLYGTLLKFGFAEGMFKADPNDGLELKSCAITNVVRCVPPENKPVASEINSCRGFLVRTIRRFPNLKAIVTLGKISHDSVVRSLDGRVAATPFGHNLAQDVSGYRIFSSYHCSRYNTNTGRLTEEMFDAVFNDIRQYLTA